MKKAQNSFFISFREIESVLKQSALENIWICGGGKTGGICIVTYCPSNDIVITKYRSTKLAGQLVRAWGDDICVQNISREISSVETISETYAWIGG
jgi:hypothetical protein